MKHVVSIGLIGLCCMAISLAAGQQWKKRSYMVTEGLKKEIVQPGRGESPKRGQKVRVHYTGWLWVNGARGREFDSSVRRGKPFEFVLGVGYVIRGWDLGVATMQLGEKALFTIDPELGYGARGAGASIPPNATLLFEVELLGFE